MMQDYNPTTIERINVCRRYLQAITIAYRRPLRRRWHSLTTWRPGWHSQSASLYYDRRKVQPTTTTTNTSLAYMAKVPQGHYLQPRRSSQVSLARMDSPLSTMSTLPRLHSRSCHQFCPPPSIPWTIPNHNANARPLTVYCRRRRAHSSRSARIPMPKPLLHWRLVPDYAELHRTHCPCLSLILTESSKNTSHP
jgi:hypothetical protein